MKFLTATALALLSATAVFGKNLDVDATANTMLAVGDDQDNTVENLNGTEDENRNRDADEDVKDPAEDNKDPNNVVEDIFDEVSDHKVFSILDGCTHEEKERIRNLNIDEMEEKDQAEYYCGKIDCIEKLKEAKGAAETEEHVAIVLSEAAANVAKSVLSEKTYEVIQLLYQANKICVGGDADCLERKNEAIMDVAEKLEELEKEIKMEGNVAAELLDKENVMENLLHQISYNMVSNWKTTRIYMYDEVVDKLRWAADKTCANRSCQVTKYDLIKQIILFLDELNFEMPSVADVEDALKPQDPKTDVTQLFKDAMTSDNDNLIEKNEKIQDFLTVLNERAYEMLSSEVQNGDKTYSEIMTILDVKNLEKITNYYYDELTGKHEKMSRKQSEVWDQLRNNSLHRLERETGVLVAQIKENKETIAENKELIEEQKEEKTNSNKIDDLAEQIKTNAANIKDNTKEIDMDNVRDYVKRQYSIEVTDEQIKEFLKTKDYSEDNVDAYIRKLIQDEPQNDLFKDLTVDERQAISQD